MLNFSLPLLCLLAVTPQIYGAAAYAETVEKHTTAIRRKGPQFPTCDKLPKVSELEWSRLPLPSQKMLDDVLSKVRSVRIIDCAIDLLGRPCSGGYNEILHESYSGDVLFESSNFSVIKELTECLRIRESETQSGAFTYGAPVIELTLLDHKVVYLGYIGRSIRWQAWRYDGDLLNSGRAAKWLANHGITKPSREAQVEAEYAKLEYLGIKASLDEFVRTMPKSLRMYFRTTPKPNLNNLSKKFENTPREQLLKLAKHSLSQQFPRVSDQIGVLLEWDGRLSDNNHHFSDGAFPIELLLEYEPSQILSKVKSSSLTPAQWVGVARYYSNYRTQQIPTRYKQIDKALRQRIVRGVKSTGKNGKDLERFEEIWRNLTTP